MAGLGPDVRKSTMAHGSISVPFNRRDASNTSPSLWKNPPTPISAPVTAERPHFRPHDNPFFTILAKTADYFDRDIHAQKRPRLDRDISSVVVTERDVQVIEPPRTTSNHIPNDAEIIELGTSSEDMGEPVSRPVRTSSPDELLLQNPKSAHAFETHPKAYTSSISYKGKDRAKPQSEVVEGSEEEEEIEEFTSPPHTGRLSNTTDLRDTSIPKHIVHDLRKVFESASASAPAAIRRPVGILVNHVGARPVVAQMRKRDEGTRGHQGNTGMVDRVGTSSSDFLNSIHDKERDLILPLKAWCLGLHCFQHSESAPLKLTYESTPQKIRVTWGPSSSDKLEFELNRDVHSAMVVNDSEEPLREDVVIQFTAKEGREWSAIERRFKGFKGGGSRGRDILTFLFSTERYRDFTHTGYQAFVTAIRRVLAKSAEMMKPSKGKTVWDVAHRYAAMFEQTELRNDEGDPGGSIVGRPPEATCAPSPSSGSPKTRTPCPESWRSSSAYISSSLRQTIRNAFFQGFAPAPAPPLAQLEADEVILTYPPTGTGVLSVMQSDLRRLQPEEYLNDTLIEFGLKLWLNDLRQKDPSFADQIHVFSSFFYKKLNRKNPEEGYKSVRKWTAKVDLFTKKYVIVPINENLHWYLAIICEPGHTLEPPLPPSHASNTPVTRKQRKKQERAAEDNIESAIGPVSTLTEAPLDRQPPAAREPEADASSMSATSTTTHSMVENEDMDDPTIPDFDKSCSITAGLEPGSSTTFDVQMRDSSPNLYHPPSDAMDIDGDISSGTIAGAPASKPSSGIPVNQFYGSLSRPGNAKEVVTVDGEDGEDQQQEAEVDDMLAITQSITPSSTGDLPAQTYIITLDSLGSRHPQALKVLRQYLISEAKDKRNFDEVRDAVGKQVQVPVQPNTWDCGIYLLHFVKVFMNAPSEFMERILSTRGTMLSSDRKKMWQDHEVPQSRDHLKLRIIELSEEWKSGKTVRDEEANRRKGRDAPEVETLSSEGEVDIVEDVPKVKATLVPREKQPALRLR
ncbi:hypothetical protein JVU11DRAFT_3380 [Chiua virens]|nr:hypothetical protein JVU11DRAFT_3380 [Chiua virens]